MGNCLGSSPHTSQAPTPTTHSTTTGISGTTSQTTSSRISNCSGQSGAFSAASGDSSFPNGQLLDAPDLRRFTFQELKAATKNFKPDNLLGEGGFGKVYRGCLEDKQHNHSSNSKSAGGTLVAVKKLKSESMQGFEEWQAEIDFLGRLSHPNLVKLLGYCWDNEDLLLIYEYLQRGSLENHLFGRGSAVKPLPWELRLKIAIGAACAFAFLHASDDRVIFRDIKAANILLDGVYNAKISDFGLAKLGPSASQSHVTTRIMGTYGYAAPEYLATGHLYIKSDVYGFGVVLIELLTGLRALDTTRQTGRHTLVDWIQPFLSHKRKLKSVMDSRLQGRYPEKAAFEIAQLSLKCLALEPRLRPSMEDVVDTLEKIQAVGENKNPREPISRNRASGQPAKKSCTGSGSNSKQQPLRNNRSSQGR